MSYAAKILADSISDQGIRLTTFEVTMPRIVLAEFNTHRMFSRNSASSRAIPVEKMLRKINEEPYVPSTWGKNQKGMQADEEISGDLAQLANEYWLWARDQAASAAQRLMDVCGVHKQTTNRLVEPYMWHTAIVTSTEWPNFFHLRDNKFAHPDIQIPARMMGELHNEYEKSTPRKYGEWHLPLLPDFEEIVSAWHHDVFPSGGLWDILCKISIARCARVSYLTHDGKRDWNADLQLYDTLLKNGHMSPLEHVARPMTQGELETHGAWDCIVEDPVGTRHVYRYQGRRDQQPVTNGGKLVHARWGAYCGNFSGWVQHRKLIPREYDMLGEAA